jgi:hypothetical protein
MKLIGTSLYLTWSQLQELSMEAVGNENAITSSSIHKGVVRFNAGQSSSWANIPNPDRDGGKSLIDYDSLPESAKAKLPSRENLLEMALETIEHKAKQASRLKAHTEVVQEAFRKGQKMAEIEKIRSLIAPDFTEINTLVKEGVRKSLATQTARQAAYIRFYNLLPAAQRKATEGTLVEAMREDHDQQLLPGPASVVNLKNWAKRYQEGGITALLTRKVGNQNAAWSDVHRKRLFDVWADLKKPSKLHAWEVYKHACTQIGEDFMSERTARHYLDQYLVESAAAISRYGSKTIAEHYLPTIKRHAGQYSFSELCGDGLKPGKRITIPVGHAWAGKHQKEIVSQINLWVWFDKVTGCIVGYDFAPSETFQQGRNALKMATKIYGALPLSVEMDRNMIKNAEWVQLFEQTGIQPINVGGVSRPMNKKAERHIQEFKRIFRKMVDEWVDMDGKTHRTKRDGMEVKEVMKKAGLKYEYQLVDEAILELIEVINAYNCKALEKFDGKSRLEVFQEIINEKCPKIDDLTRAMMFGNTRVVSLKTTSKENRGQLTFDVGTVEYTYMIPAHAYATGNVQPKMRVYYDELEPENAALYMMENENDPSGDHFISELIWMPTVNEVVVEMTSQDYKNYNKQKANREAFAALVDGFIETKHGLMDPADLDMATIGQEMMKGYANVEIVAEKAKQYASIAKEQYERSTNRNLRKTESEPVEVAVRKTGTSRYDRLLNS